MTSPSDMRVYVGTYGKYNEGSIEGAWLDIEDYSDKEEFEAACQELHGPGEHEFMFQDWEGFPEGMIGESFIDPEVFELGQLSEDDFELLKIYREHVDQDGTLEKAQEELRGTGDSPEDFVETYLEETGQLGEVPDWLRNHIDFKSIARDWDIDGFTFVNVDGTYWVFG